MVDNIIASLIGVLMVVIFLGFYMYRVPSVPLIIIMAGVIVMIAIESYESLREGNGNSED